ncbi:hypothetical protein BASA60_005968 [Batrachochytrium salamandrivorans]|nr:hypothetical protein BASA60_005968 [Batrachochytrium salamandrivorans]
MSSSEQLCIWSNIHIKSQAEGIYLILSGRLQFLAHSAPKVELSLGLRIIYASGFPYAKPGDLRKAMQGARIRTSAVRDIRWISRQAVQLLVDADYVSAFTRIITSLDATIVKSFKAWIPRSEAADKDKLAAISSFAAKTVTTIQRSPDVKARNFSDLCSHLLVERPSRQPLLRRPRFGFRPLALAYHTGDTTIPRAWLCASIVSIDKKDGDPLNPGDKRGIALINVGLKLVCKVLQMRIERFVETNNLLSYEQAGFRKRERVCWTSGLTRRHHSAQTECWD